MINESPISSTDVVNTPSPNANLQKKRRFPILTIMNILVLLITLAVLGYGGRYILQLKNSLIQENEHLASSLSTTEKKLTTQEQKLQNLQQQLSIFQNQNQMRTTWFLSQAEYLTKLASFVLSFQNDVITARKILLAADLQLQTLNNPQIWPVRKVIAQDIAAINAVSPVDLPGIVARLDVISQQVEQLPRVPSLTINPEALKPQTKKSQNQGLVDQLKTFSLAVSENLKGLFEIQYDAPLAAPLLPPDQYLQIVSNIQFQLTMAQWAALHQQPDIYKQSLQRAHSWIARYYSGSDNTAKSILSNLQELEQIAVKPAAPDLSRSLTALQAALSKAEGANP